MVAASAIPYKFTTPWAADAATANVTNPIPPTASGGSASQQQGFPLITATPVGSGGIPPAFADFNGFGLYLSSWAQWVQVGGPIGYDSVLSSAIGGYPAGSVIAVSGTLGAKWVSLADNNTSDPDTGGANWSGGVVSAGFDAGGMNFRMTTTTYGSGWRNDGTSTYFLLTNSGSANGSYNSLRPIIVTNSTGAIVIDQTGVGVTAGGSVGVAGNLSSNVLKPYSATSLAILGGTSGLFFNNSSDTTTNVSVDDSGNVLVRGNLTANQAGTVITGNEVRAAVGAAGSGDPNRCTILADFQSTVTGTTFIMKFPNGDIIQGGTTSSINDTYIPFNVAFPNNVTSVTVSESNAGPSTWGVANPTLHAWSPSGLAGFTHWTVTWQSGGWINANNGFSWFAQGN